MPSIGNLEFRKKCAVILIILVFHSITIHINVIQSNPIYIGGDTIEMGGLLPSSTSNNLSMIEAEVLMKIDSTNYENKTIEVEFYGKYQIANPNETIELIIAAPLNIEFTGNYYNNDTRYDIQINDTLQIFVDENEINFSLSILENITGWENYLADYNYYWFFITNVTFPGYTTTELIYTWNAIVEFDDSSNYAIFYYDVGTARGWKGNLTERVTCEVQGEQPTSYTDQKYGILSKPCIVTEFGSGKNYSWFWENEAITDYYVGVEYDFSSNRGISLLNAVIMGVTLSLSILTIIIVFVSIIKKRRKKRSAF